MAAEYDLDDGSLFCRRNHSPLGWAAPCATFPRPPALVEASKFGGAAMCRSPAASTTDMEVLSPAVPSSRVGPLASPAASTTINSSPASEASPSFVNLRLESDDMCAALSSPESTPPSLNPAIGCKRNGPHDGRMCDEGVIGAGLSLRASNMSEPQATSGRSVAGSNATNRSGGWSPSTSSQFSCSPATPLCQGKMEDTRAAKGSCLSDIPGDRCAAKSPHSGREARAETGRGFPEDIVSPLSRSGSSAASDTHSESRGRRSIARDNTCGGLADDIGEGATSARSQQVVGCGLGFTTRSGRRSKPVIKLSAGEKGPPVVGSGLGFTTRSGRKSNPVIKLSAGGKGPLVTHPTKSRASTNETRKRVRSSSPAAKRRKISVVASKAKGRVVGNVHGRARTAVSPGQEEPSANLGKTTRSGRQSAPVLEWWRSQRLTQTSGGKVVVASGPSKDELFPGRQTMAPPSTLPTSKRCATGSQYGPRHGGVGVAEGEEPSWTQAQLQSLRIAQMGTLPSAKDFWGAVASKVEGRDPQQCQHKWFEHFATPRVRRRKSRGEGATTAQGSGRPLEKKTPNSWRGAQRPEDGLSSEAQYPPALGADDLFQATPMRGKSRFGNQLRGGEVLGSSTPRTPAGPGAPTGDVSAENNPGQAPSDVAYKRGVSRTYVQAMSKKMRQACGATQSGSVRVLGPSKSKPHGAAGRKIHASSTSQGRALRASVSASGAVNVTSTGGSSDEEGSYLSDVGESDDGYN